MPVVYIDVLFLVNVMIDGMLLWCSTKIAGVHTKWWRIGIAAIVGGIYAVCIFFPQLSPLYVLVAKVAVSIIMVCIAFWVKTWRELLRAILIFYVMSFLFGGGITGLIYFTGLGSNLGTVVSNGSIYFNLPWKLLLVTAAAVLLTVTIVVKYLKNFLMRQGLLGKLRITYGEKTAQTDVLLDTGNQLKDPLTGRAVAVVELSRLRALLPAEVYTLFEQYHVEELYEQLSYDWTTRLRMIPYSGVGVENGMLIGITPDRVEIGSPQQGYRECQCIIAMYPGKLKHANGSGGIVNPSLLF